MCHSLCPEHVRRVVRILWHLAVLEPVEITASYQPQWILDIIEVIDCFLTPNKLFYSQLLATYFEQFLVNRVPKYKCKQNGSETARQKLNNENVVLCQEICFGFNLFI